MLNVAEKTKQEIRDLLAKQGMWFQMAFLDSIIKELETVKEQNNQLKERVARLETSTTDN